MTDYADSVMADAHNALHEFRLQRQQLCTFMSAHPPRSEFFIGDHIFHYNIRRMFGRCTAVVYALIIGWFVLKLNSLRFEDHEDLYILACPRIIWDDIFFPTLYVLMFQFHEYWYSVFVAYVRENY